MGLLLNHPIFLIPIRMCLKHLSLSSKITLILRVVFALDKHFRGGFGSYFCQPLKCISCFEPPPQMRSLDCYYAHLSIIALIPLITAIVSPVKYLTLIEMVVLSHRTITLSIFSTILMLLVSIICFV